jgi:hypothetical protein
MEVSQLLFTFYCSALQDEITKMKRGLGGGLWTVPCSGIGKPEHASLQTVGFSMETRLKNLPKPEFLYKRVDGPLAEKAEKYIYL